ALAPARRKTRSPVLKQQAIRKISGSWLALRRVLFSMDDRSQQDVKFYCVVTADIASGFEIFQLAYSRDLVKMSFSMVQVPEFQHRIVTEYLPVPQARGDRQGKHLKMKDFAFREFIVLQVANRVESRFKGENNNLDHSPIEGMTDVEIDRDVARIALETLRIYDYKDVTSLETNNLLTRSKALFDESDIAKRFRR
ncbi:MAG: hypothetical protein PHT59_05525, partial [Candidatus Omnitrophica bacterium]|nr:hypothetical protein [Candidatus Omnitrophota bacterium]